MSTPRPGRSSSGSPLATAGSKRGVVRRFDEAAGLGEVGVEVEVGRSFPFHCTQIADGTRSIPEGTEVYFGLRAGHRGVWEASQLRPI